MQSINCCLLKEGKGEGRPTDGRGTKGHTQNGKRRRRRARSYKKGKEIAKHMKRRHLVGEFWYSFRDVTFFRLSCEECSNQGKEEKRGPFLVFEDDLKGTQKKRGDYGYRYHVFFPPPWGFRVLEKTSWWRKKKQKMATVQQVDYCCHLPPVLALLRVSPKEHMWLVGKVIVPFKGQVFLGSHFRPLVEERAFRNCHFKVPSGTNMGNRVQFMLEISSSRHER